LPIFTQNKRSRSSDISQIDTQTNEQMHKHTHENWSDRQTDKKLEGGYDSVHFYASANMCQKLGIAERSHNAKKWKSQRIYL